MVVTSAMSTSAALAVQEASHELSQDLSARGLQITKRKGTGQYGKVFKVHRSMDGQDLAMKVVNITASDVSEEQQRSNVNKAVNEAHLLMSNRHINVIYCHEAFVSKDGKYLCLIMEYAPKGDLSYYICKSKDESKPFHEEIVWRVLLQLCSGLKALHASQIVHRDLKPANILFMGKGDLIKIADMGLSKALELAGLTYTFVGTENYMAPEVWQGCGYDFSSDLWSLGVVLYEMMTFCLPCDGVNSKVRGGNIVRGIFTPVPDAAPGLYSQGLIDICHALLSTDRTLRPTLESILQSDAAKPYLNVVPKP